jgi:hypothetical protein
VPHPGAGSPNRLLHSWSGINDVTCDAQTKRFKCAVAIYHDDSTITTKWYVDGVHQPSLDNRRTFSYTPCTVGRSYDFAVEVTHASGLSGTARVPRVCRGTPDHR